MATHSPIKVTIRGQSKDGSVIARSRALRTIRAWRRTGSRISGKTEPDGMALSSRSAVLAGTQVNVTLTFSGGYRLWITSTESAGRTRGMPAAGIKENARNSRYPAAGFARVG